MESKEIIIPFAEVNQGFTFEEAFCEGTDDSLEVDNSEVVDSWCDVVENKAFSYLIGDKAGGAIKENIFNITSGISFAKKYANVSELNSKTGLFNAGSLSHLNVSDNVWVWTRNNKGWSGIHLSKIYETGDFLKQYVDINPNNVISADLIEKYKINLEQYDTILYVVDFETATDEVFQQTGDIIEGLEKNLRCTYATILKQGKQLTFNNKFLKPLDPFYKDKIGSNANKTFEISISLSELLNSQQRYKEEVYKRYLPIFEVTYGKESAEKELLNQEVIINCYKFDTDYFNKHYFKQNAQDAIIFNGASSGFWLFRNGRRIGIPAKIKDLNTGHNSYNGLRATVDFNPVFDLFLGIQVNKNRYKISEVFRKLLIQKVNDVARRKLVKNIKELLTSNNSNENEQLDLPLDINEDEEIEKHYKQEHKILPYFKWNNAEQLVLIHERNKGYIAEDVSKSNVGYDIESYNPITKEKRCIEVKSIEKVYDDFALTNPEYAHAHSIKDNYYVCIVLQGKDTVRFEYLKDPSNTYEFYQRIKQIEWVCEEYSGEVETVDYD